MAKKVNLEGVKLAELYSEIGRRRNAMVQNRRSGSRPTCECGTCLKCKKRISQAKYREEKKKRGKAA